MPPSPFPPEPPRRSSSTALIVVLIALIVLLAVPMMLAVIGILAAIAIPNFVVYTQRAKLSEVEMTLGAIARGEDQLFADQGVYVACPVAPDIATDPPTRMVRHVPTDPCWDALPMMFGDQYCNYGVEVRGEPGSAGYAYVARAYCDVDGDGIWAEWERWTGESNARQLNLGEY